jgi:uncharacterized repeat protein (TIGR03833 family)
VILANGQLTRANNGEAGPLTGRDVEVSQGGCCTVNGQDRKDVKPGLHVEIVLKQHQRSGKRTRGVVKDILTNSPHHVHGIKVRLETGEVGRVQQIVE